MTYTAVYLVILCGVIHTVPVVIDNIKEIPTTEEMRYINREEEGTQIYLDIENEERGTKSLNSEEEIKTRYLDSNNERPTRCLDGEDTGRPRYLDSEDERRRRYIENEDRPRYISNAEEGRPRYMTAGGEETWPDEILLPGFLALQASDLAGYLVSNMAFKLTKALLYMLWL